MADNRPLFDPPEPSVQAPEETGYTTRDLWRFVNYYCTRIRAFPNTETGGVIRNIQRMLAKGISLEEIAIALRNYEEDDWRKKNDPRYSMHIRSFFKAETIKQWQTPRPKLKQSRLPFVTIQPTTKPTPVQVQQQDEIDDEL